GYRTALAPHTIHASQRSIQRVLLPHLRHHDGGRPMKVLWVVLPWAVLLALLGLWELVVQQSSISALVLPAPSAVLQSLWTSLQTGYLWPHIGATLAEMLLGLTLGGMAG